MKFLVNEQTVPEINAISLCLDLNIFQKDECFCSKLGLIVEHANSNLRTLVSQIWVICHLLPFVRVGQNCLRGLISNIFNRSVKKKNLKKN